MIRMRLGVSFGPKLLAYGTLVVHCGLRVKAPLIGDVFVSETNTTLRILDVQWNHFRKDSGKVFCEALKVRIDRIHF